MTELKIPRPKRGGEGQWGLGYREPLNAAEQMKRDDNPLNVKERILEYAAAWKRGEISSIDQIFVADLRSRFRWYGLYTQRPEEDGFFMWRIRIPGGVLTSDQTRAIGKISQEFGKDVADITDRQNIQLHWIRLPDVPEIWERLEAVGLQTTEACGDTPRNILGCPLAGVDADEIIDGTELVNACDERIVGDPEFSNLPRKYKMSITGCRHQCAVHEANDVGFVGNELDDGTKGFDVWVGGGLSSTPHFGQRLGAFVKPEQVVDVYVGITSVFRDYGYRRSRNKARLKFLMADWGPELFRRVLEEKYLGYKLADGPPAKPSVSDANGSVHRDHTGVGRQKDGQNYLGFALRNGRITGTELCALADLADEEGQGRLRATVQQKMVLLDVPDERLAATMDKLDALGFPVFSSAFRTGMMACTGIEFCKLSIVETKARAEWLYADLESRLPDFDEPLRINVNGCPNSCARYQLADIGFMGVLVTEKVNGNGEVERLEGFNVHLGGHLGEPKAFGRKVRGLRLRADELSSFAERVLRVYKEQRNGHRSFGDWVNSLDTKTVNDVAQTAAQGLERVGPKPVSSEESAPMTTEMKSVSDSHISSLPLAEYHPDPGDLDELSKRFEHAHPREILAWAFEYIPDLAIGTSFQLGGLANIFLAREVVDPVRVLFLETGFHFPETIEFKNRLAEDWGLELLETKPTLGPERQAVEIHPELYRVDPDQCCYLNKVLPMEAALENLGGWATGVRRDQSPSRLSTNIFEVQQLTSGKVIWKVNPQAHWTRAQVEEFVRQHNIPTHPLYEKGYVSIGCAPCTRPVGTDEDERAGRWDGFDKAECGIHVAGNGDGDSKKLPVRARA